MSQFLAWIASLPALAQVPLVIVAFLAVVGLLIFFIEIAPRRGRLYTGIRLAVCVLAPLLVFLSLGSVAWAAIVAAVIGGLFFILDYRSREGGGYLFQLIGFLAPAILLLTIGLIYPSIKTMIDSFYSGRGTFVGFNNFIWLFTQPSAVRTVINTIIWVLFVPTLSTAFGLAYAVFIDKSRGEKFFKVLVFMPMAISFVGASIIWRFVYESRPADQAQIGLLNQIVVWFGGICGFIFRLVWIIIVVGFFLILVVAFVVFIFPYMCKW